jgi:hypothetical protein
LDLTTDPTNRHQINRPEFPEFPRRNFRNPQRTTERSGEAFVRL